MLKKVIAAALLCGASANMALADEAVIRAAAEEFAKTEISKWAAEPELIAAITQANTARAALTQSQIDELDQKWRAEEGAEIHPTIDDIMKNPASAKLASFCDAQNSLVTEMILMDNKGLNVALCDPTSDYWQGDEAKWRKTFPVGPGAVFVDELEQDDSTRKFQLQTSVTVVDPVSGQAIGALTVGLDADALTAR